MIKHYEHTQVGYLIIVAMAATMVLIGIVLAKAGINWIAIGVLVIPGDEGDEIHFSLPNFSDPVNPYDIEYSLIGDEIIREHPAGTTKILARNVNALTFSNSSDLITIRISTTTAAKGRDLSFSLTEKVLMRN